MERIFFFLFLFNEIIQGGGGSTEGIAGEQGTQKKPHHDRKSKVTQHRKACSSWQLMASG